MRRRGSGILGRMFALAAAIASLALGSVPGPAPSGTLACGQTQAGAAAPLEWVRVFEGLELPAGLDRPIAVGAWPGDEVATEAAHYLADRAGNLVRFTRREGAKLALRLPVGAGHSAEGLLGLAFHPQFPADPRLFVQYTEPKARRSVVASVQLSARDATRFDWNTLVEWIEIEQPWSDHNGGPLCFGPGGLLYVAVGDGGSQGDPRGHAQNSRSLLGKILAIDVDAEETDRIEVEPRSDLGEGARPEIFALGVRDPRALVFGGPGQELFVLDSGPESFEELSLVRAGDNLGWPLREGFVDFAPRASQGPGHRRDPLAVIPHRQAARSVGGCLYKGQRHPEFAGSFTFAGGISGTVFAVKLATNRGEPVAQPQAIGRIERPCAIGLDHSGEWLVVDRVGQLWSAP